MTPDVDIQALAIAVAEQVAVLQTPSRLMTAEQASELLNVPASWVLSEARANRLPCVRLGRYVRFQRGDLAAYLDRRASK
jgi:excisionase family DNA binding protein